MTLELRSRQHEVTDALAAIDEYFEKGWTDGLPIVPPTEDRVRACLEAARLNPDDVLGTVPNRGRVITAEKVAINAVMAGCLPEYMPVVAAAVRAMADPRFNLHGSLASTAGAAPLIVVNGPIAKSIGINAGDNVFGPGWRANATIGRSLRLVLMNICGAQPGIMDKAALGHPGKYTYCIGEREEDSPWTPMHVERGMPAGSSAVTVFAAEAPHYVKNDHGNRPETILAQAVDILTRTNGRSNGYLIVICPEHLNILLRYGWTKADVRGWVTEHAKRSVASLKRTGWLPGDVEPGDETTEVRWIDNPDQVMVVVAGGRTAGTSAIVPPWAGRPSTPVTVPVG